LTRLSVATSDRSLPAGPRLPPVLQTLRWLVRPIAFLEACRREFGDAFSVRFLGFERPMVMLSDPETIQVLYKAPEHALPPGRTLALRPIMGPRSVLLLEGREHLARRRLMLPPFHGQRMRAYESIVRDVVALRAPSADAARHARGHPAQQDAELQAGGSGVRQQPSQVLGQSLPAGRVRDAEDRAARFEDGAPMTDGEIRDQLITLLLAGHETTATGLAWTFDLLLRHPEALARLLAEIDAGSDDAYVRAVVAESLRLRPVVPLAGRRLASELRVGPHVLPPVRTSRRRSGLEAVSIPPLKGLEGSAANSFG
jgi:cytochrome P450